MRGYLCAISATLLSGVALAFALPGCSSKDSSSSSPPSAGESTTDHSNHAHRQAGGATDMEKMKAELAKLPPEDAASAEKQHVCPVSGEMLGTMGAPQKIDVNGQMVWICCEGCKEQLLAQPDKFLAKLKKG